MAVNWPYIAGFFDGEGSIGVTTYPQGRRASAYIAQSGRLGMVVLTKIKDFLAKHEIKCSIFETGKAGKHKRTMPSYRLAVNGSPGTIKFLHGMLPYLEVKRTPAQDVIRYDIMFPSILKSDITREWRREKQRKSAVRGDAWKARYAGRKMGRPKG